ncbi:MAG: OmpA family protein [Deltaproteobacteria bacterium]|nr:OmpA family protein [Deltaproteobacteria bacterium]
MNRNRRTLFTLAAELALVAAIALPPAPARSDNPKVNVNMFRPSPHPGDVLGIYTAAEPKHLDWGIGAWLSFAGKPLRLADDGGEIVSWQGVADIQGHLGLLGFLDVGLTLPLVVAGGDPPLGGGVRPTPRWPTEVEGFSLGDLRLGLKGTFLGGNGKGFGLALAEDLTFPTATGENFAGDELVTSTTTLVLDFSMRGWVAAVNFGIRGKKAVALLGNDAESQMLMGAGVAVPFICGVLEGLGTVETRTALSEPFASPYDNAVDFMGGLRLNWQGLTMIAAAGGSALDAYGSPAWRVALNAGYQPEQEKGCFKDADRDGIQDADDACPADPGPAATRGCPDRDGDGIADADDSCVDLPGPRELNGCPDRDRDGVIDVLDLCPDVQGPAQHNGCPDTDKDGIPDLKDACPADPGPEKLKGCPDRDGDGIADREDKCPEVYGKKEFDGCPPPTPSTVRVTAKKIEILQQVHFATNKAVIRKDSFQLLHDVAKVLNDNPHIRKIRVEGHTDNVGKPAKNLTLSQQRAGAVKTFLVNAGVAADRLDAQGFGDTRPVDDNSLPAGRAANRRVEFVIVESAPAD